MPRRKFLALFCRRAVHRMVLNLRADHANSILDHRHRFTLSIVYDMPFFKNGNAFMRNTAGSWEIAPIYTYQSGQWVTAQSGIDSNLNGDSAGDRTILNPSGVKGTGTGVVPLCTSAVATCPSHFNGCTQVTPQAWWAIWLRIPMPNTSRLATEPWLPSAVTRCN